MKRISLFKTPMDVAAMDETVDLIAKRIRKRKFTQHVVVNVAKIVHAQKDKQLAASMAACHIINIDGMGVVWGARILGVCIPERVSGVDLFGNLVEMAACEKFPIFLLGATDVVVSSVSVKLQELHTELIIAGFHHGYFWDDEAAIVKRIRDSGARMLFVAITSPKKENFINRWKDQLGVDFVMGVGGTFDVVAGKVRRAPVWMQRAGMEWLYRVIQEPTRMWKRYLVTNSIFAVMLVRALIAGPKQAQ